jgi:hypothetical protein
LKEKFPKKIRLTGLSITRLKMLQKFEEKKIRAGTVVDKNGNAAEILKSPSPVKKLTLIPNP